MQKKRTIEPKPIISFEFLPKSYGEFSFKGTSTNADTYVWDFGDGGTDYTLSPNYLYKKNGTYTVRLTATGKGGVSTIFRTVVVSTVRGEVTFWSDNAQYPIDVTLDNKYLDTIGSNYTSVPSCGATGTAHFTLLREGVYNYTAKEKGRASPRTWAGTVTIINGECTKHKLFIR